MSNPPYLYIPVSEEEWGKLSSSTRNSINRIEQRTCEFIRHVYSNHSEVAEEILKRIGFVDENAILFPTRRNQK